MTFKIHNPVVGDHAEDYTRILLALPEWFGIEEATKHYIDSAQTLPTILAVDDKEVIGFLTLKHHSPHTSEIYVMAVHPDYHRHGVGQAMLSKAEAVLGASHVEFLQVKTLSASHPDPNYALTRKFYMAQDFRIVEEFPTLWNESNPCLLLIKCLNNF